MLRILSFLKAEGLCQPTPAALPELLADPERITWVDFDDPSDEETRLLTTFFHFHPLAIEDALAELHDPKVDDYGDYLYLVLHGSQSEKIEEEVGTREIDIFMGRNYLVTYHEGPSRSIAKTLEKCERNAAIMGKDPERILHAIVDAMVDNYLPLMDRLGEEIEELEDAVFSNPTPEILGRIFSVKKNLLYLRRILYPQRDVVRKLGDGSFPLICRECSLLFRDTHDHLYMIAALIESHRDTMTGATEVYLSVVSNRLNAIVKVLTIFATIMGTLTVITGIYGMNFEFLPGARSRYGFHAMAAFMVLVVLAMLWFFRRKKWLE